MLTPKNARSRPVTKLCLALESFRRTEEGRVRDAKAFLGFYLPYEGGKDRLFVHVPNEIRAELLSEWGVRGKKSALRDDDEKVRTTLVDALAAGDVDAAILESGVTPEILIDWAPLTDWWSFWRGAALPPVAVRKALATARELELFDDTWFLANLALPGAKLTGTDVVCAALSKDQIMAWLHALHGSEDASPAGLVRAVGWDTVLTKTAHDALLFALDALAVRLGLAPGGTTPTDDDVTPRPTSVAPVPSAARSTSGAPTAVSAAPAAIVVSAPPAAVVVSAPPAAVSAPPAVVSAPPATVSGPAAGAPPAAVSAPPAAAVSAPPAAVVSAPPATVSGPAAVVGTPPAPVVSVGSPPAKASKAPEPTASSPTLVTEAPTTPKIVDAPSSSSAATSSPPRTSQKPAAPPVPARAPAISAPPTATPSGRPPPPRPTPSTPPRPPATSAPAPSSTSAPPSSPLTARALFGAPSKPASAPPMRPKAMTLAGVGGELPMFGDPLDPPEVDPPSEPSHGRVVPPAVVAAAMGNEPAWAPPKAEPGDMGWDLVHGVSRPLTTNVQPKYNFEEDDEPTSEIALPGAPRR